MKIAQICGPYRADTPEEISLNISIARAYAEKYWRLGYGVICPHLNSSHMSGVVAEHRFLDFCTELIKRGVVDILVVIPGFSSSIGSLREITVANECNVKVKYEEPLTT